MEIAIPFFVIANVGLIANSFSAAKLQLFFDLCKLFCDFSKKYLVFWSSGLLVN